MILFPKNRSHFDNQQGLRKKSRIFFLAGTGGMMQESIESDALNYMLGQNWMRSRFKRWVYLKNSAPSLSLALLAETNTLSTKKRLAIDY